MTRRDRSIEQTAKNDGRVEQASLHKALSHNFKPLSLFGAGKKEISRKAARTQRSKEASKEETQSHEATKQRRRPHLRAARRASNRFGAARRSPTSSFLRGFV
jgi:hypothetical protein